MLARLPCLACLHRAKKARFFDVCRGEDKEEFLEKLEARELARAEEIKMYAARWNLEAVAAGKAR